MILPLIITIALANDLPGEELFVSEQKPAPSQPVRPAKLRYRPATDVPSSASVLPQEYLRPLYRQSTESSLIQTPKGAIEVFKAIKTGDSIPLLISHSIIAFPDEKSPVVAIPTQTKFKGIKFLGESNLEPNTKRIFISFNKIAVGQNVYQLRASGLPDNGQPGFIGEHHSREAEYFAGNFISAFTAAYFDSLVPRSTNVFGQVQEDTSTNSAFKKGLASGSMATADRFKEKLKQVPEFSELKGPIELSALILEQPTSKE